MHELGICQAVVDAVVRRAAGRPVAKVRVRAGALQAIHAEAFEMNFALVAAGTVAEGASAELVTVPGDELLVESIEYRASRLGRS
jgi:hydrogenase nickel incorporation protein HypA/HybF